MRDGNTMLKDNDVIIIGNTTLKYLSDSLTQMNN
ncbi:MAG: hypothetical protein IPM42_03485 [Saprospiraceae bacterium]|nr:hypothetical protein [Saprospiraceae bacterium]